jgi:hypothetical protein
MVEMNNKKHMEVRDFKLRLSRMESMFSMMQNQIEEQAKLILSLQTKKIEEQLNLEAEVDLLLSDDVIVEHLICETEEKDENEADEVEVEEDEALEIEVRPHAFPDFWRRREADEVDEADEIEEVEEDEADEVEVDKVEEDEADEIEEDEIEEDEVDELNEWFRCHGTAPLHRWAISVACPGTINKYPLVYKVSGYRKMSGLYYFKRMYMGSPLYECTLLDSTFTLKRDLAGWCITDTNEFM